ncbi:MAG: hypothetical protein ACI9XZ_001851, partial [Alphaproteobacteria bacterium]
MRFVVSLRVVGYSPCGDAFATDHALSVTLYPS